MLAYPRLQNDDLILRRPQEKDEQKLCCLFGTALSKERTEQMMHFFAGQYAKKKEMFLVIADAEDEAVGILELYHFDTEEAEAGYRILPKKQGHGYATKALSICLEWLCRQGVKRVTARVSQDNIPSQKVLARNGFHRKEDTDKEWILVYQWEVCHDQN